MEIRKQTDDERKCFLKDRSIYQRHQGDREKARRIARQEKSTDPRDRIVVGLER